MSAEILIKFLVVTSANNWLRSLGYVVNHGSDLMEYKPAAFRIDPS